MKIKLKELKTKKKFQEFLKKTNPEVNGILPIEKGKLAVYTNVEKLWKYSLFSTSSNNDK